MEIHCIENIFKYICTENCWQHKSLQLNNLVWNWWNVIFIICLEVTGNLFEKWSAIPILHISFCDWVVVIVPTYLPCRYSRAAVTSVKWNKHRLHWSNDSEFLNSHYSYWMVLCTKMLDNSHPRGQPLQVNRLTRIECLGAKIHNVFEITLLTFKGALHNKVQSPTIPEGSSRKFKNRQEKLSKYLIFDFF